MFIKGRKKSSYTLSDPNVSTQPQEQDTRGSNIVTNVIQKTHSRSSSKNFNLDLPVGSTERSKKVVSVDTDALKKLVEDLSKNEILDADRKPEKHVSKIQKYKQAKQRDKQSGKSHSPNILQRIIRHCSCHEQIKNKIYEGYYEGLALPWPVTIETKAAAEPPASLTAENQPIETTESKLKHREDKGMKPSNSDLCQNASLQVASTAEDKGSDRTDQLQLLSSKNSSRSCFKIKKIVVKVADSGQKFVEQDLVVRRLNEQLDILDSTLKGKPLELLKSPNNKTTEAKRAKRSKTADNKNTNSKTIKEMKKCRKLKKSKRTAPAPPSLSDSSKSLEIPPPTRTKAQSATSPKTKQKDSTKSPKNDPAAITAVAVPLVSSRSHTRSSLMKLFNISTNSNNNNNDQASSSTSMNKLANRTSTLFYLNDQPRNVDITDTQKMYETWGLKPGYGRNLDSWEIRCGMHDWSLWRSKINDYLVLTSMFSSLNDFLNSQKNTETSKPTDDQQQQQLQSHKPSHNRSVDAEKPSSSSSLDLINNFKIEPSLARFIYYYGFARDAPKMEPDSFMFYGIPRARLLGDNNKIETKTTKPIVTGISVKEKVKEFETKKLKTSQPSTGVDKKLIENDNSNPEQAQSESNILTTTTTTTTSELVERNKSEQIISICDEIKDVTEALKTPDSKHVNPSFQVLDEEVAIVENKVIIDSTSGSLKLLKTSNSKQIKKRNNNRTKTDMGKKSSSSKVHKTYHTNRKYYCSKHKRYHTNQDTETTDMTKTSGQSTYRMREKSKQKSVHKVFDILANNNNNNNNITSDSYDELKISKSETSKSSKDLQIPSIKVNDDSNNKIRVQSAPLSFESTESNTIVNISTTTTPDLSINATPKQSSSDLRHKSPPSTVADPRTLIQKAKQSLRPVPFSSLTPPPLPIPPPPSLAKHFIYQSCSNSAIEMDPTKQQQLMLAANSANNLRENHKNLSKIVSSTHRMPPPIPNTSKKAASCSPIPPLPPSAVNTRARHCKSKLEKQQALMVDAEVKANLANLSVATLRNKSKNRTYEIVVPVTSSQSRTARTVSSSSEHSLKSSKVENQQSIELIRESTKAKLIFMHQKLATQKILNKTEKKMVINSSTNNKEKCTKGMRHEYEFDYENEIGSWLSEQSSSLLFDTTKQTISSNQSSAHDVSYYVDTGSHVKKTTQQDTSSQEISLHQQQQQTKPKTSKEILKEIVRLTNGTTPSRQVSLHKSDSIKSTNFETICNLNKSSEQLKNSKN